MSPALLRVTPFYAQLVQPFVSLSAPAHHQCDYLYSASTPILGQSPIRLFISPFRHHVVFAFMSTAHDPTPVTPHLFIPLFHSPRTACGPFLRYKLLHSKHNSSHSYSNILLGVEHVIKSLSTYDDHHRRSVRTHGCIPQSNRTVFCENCHKSQCDRTRFLMLMTVNGHPCICERWAWI
jgi:hypothetical protein